MLTSIITLIVGVIVITLIVAATKPSNFRTARSITINAEPSTIFPLITDFRTWTKWSPYEKLDPNMKKSYSGAENGKGAIYEWQGTKAGSGRMEIVEVNSPSSVKIQLDFTKPMKAHNMAEFTLEPAGDSTTVTWAMTGSRPYMIKVISIFVNMDNLVGKDFESGLANMKAAVEK